MLTPAAISASAVGISPFRAAYISVVKPLAVEARGSAWASSSTRAMSGCGSPTAHINAVLCVSAVAVLTSAPCSRSASTTATLPVREAIIRGVSPLVWAAFASAPASSSFVTIATLRFSLARASGVTPWSSAASTLAPARSNRSVTSRSSQCAAHRCAKRPVPPRARGGGAALITDKIFEECAPWFGSR